jgi:hypothetical protein
MRPERAPLDVQVEIAQRQLEQALVVPVLPLGGGQAPTGRVQVRRRSGHGTFVA